MDDNLKLPLLYQPDSVADLLTPDTVSKLLLGFTAGLDSLATAIQERKGKRHDLWGSPEKYWCKFCKHLRRELNMENKCIEWDREVAQVLLEEKIEDYPGQKKKFENVFRCHSGLLDFAEVIRLRDRPFAVLHGGQLIHEEEISNVQSIQDRLTQTDLGLTTEQVEDLIKLLKEDNNHIVNNKKLEEKEKTFRQFARELELLLDKLYNERRHATEEVLLHVLADHILLINVTTRFALWDSFSKLFTELRRTTGLTHIEWFMASEEERFHFTAKTNSEQNWRHKTLSLGSFWQDLLYHQGVTTGKRWDAKIRQELELVEDTVCLTFPTTCSYGAPQRNIPALLVMVCHKADKGMLEALLSRIAIEITRGVSTVISEIEKNKVIEEAAAQGAYVGHDMKMPLHVLVNVVPAIRGCITRLKISDADLLANMKRCEDAVKSAQDKATELEQMPVRKFIVRPRMKKLDLVPILDNVVSIANGLGTTQGVTVQWIHRPDKPVYCDIDIKYLNVALHAVFDNAVKFSFIAKTVDVSLELKSEHNAVLEVRNLGVGIQPEKMIAIFEFGKRGNVEDKKNTERFGSGLGLPFAKRIIEAHQGSIHINSHSTLNLPSENDDYLSHVVTVIIRLPIVRSI